MIGNVQTAEDAAPARTVRRAPMRAALVFAAVGTAAALAAAPGAPALAAAQPIVVAHRGGAAYAPENTLAAVKYAWMMRAHWLETDIQRTKDGRLVLMHDPTLRRTTNVETLYPKRRPWKVGSFTLKQVKRLDAGSWFGHRFRGVRVPTMRQYLRLLDRTGQGVLLEIKSPTLYPGMVKQMYRELRREGWLDTAHRGRLVVQSFDAGAVHAFHKLAPKVRTAVIGAPSGARLRADAKFADVISPKFTDVTKKYVASVHGTRGVHGERLRLMVWTVDDQKRARRLAGDGVDGVITDRPDLRP
jgi:glycerophosphoryl diester phosphodiesterase